MTHSTLKTKETRALLWHLMENAPNEFRTSEVTPLGCPFQRISGVLQSLEQRGWLTSKKEYVGGHPRSVWRKTREWGKGWRL